MRAVVQRVKRADVKVGDEVVGNIEGGFLILLAIHRDDEENMIMKLAEKVVKLRIFSDVNEKMNDSIKDIGGEILVISQFTLYGDTKDGNRPSFIESARPEKAESFYLIFIEELKKLGIKKVASGRFGAHMEVSLVNDGPTTIILDF